MNTQNQPLLSFKGTREKLRRDFEALGEMWQTQANIQAGYIFKYEVSDDDFALSLCIWDDNDELSYAPSLDLWWVHYGSGRMANECVEFGYASRPMTASGPSVSLGEVSANHLFKVASRWLNRRWKRSGLLGVRV